MKTIKVKQINNLLNKWQQIVIDLYCAIDSSVANDDLKTAASLQDRIKQLKTDIDDLNKLINLPPIENVAKIN